MSLFISLWGTNSSFSCQHPGTRAFWSKYFVLRINHSRIRLRLRLHHIADIFTFLQYFVLIRPGHDHDLVNVIHEVYFLFSVKIFTLRIINCSAGWDGPGPVHHLVTSNWRQPSIFLLRLLSLLSLTVSRTEQTIRWDKDKYKLSVRLNTGQYNINTSEEWNSINVGLIQMHLAAVYNHS